MRLPRTLLAALATAALAVAAPSARADILQLKDGRFVEGVRMRLADGQVVLMYKSGDVKVPMELVEDFVIEGVVAYEPKTDEEKEMRAQGLVLYKGKWVKAEQRDKAVAAAIAKRKADLEEQKSHQEWRNRYKWESKNFKFESTLPPPIGQQYEALLETYIEDAKKTWNIKVPKEWGKLKVCLYRDRKTFNETGGARGGVLAYYRFVEPRELNCYYDRTDPELALHCALHEATHYITDLIDPVSQFPHWINESMAEYLGGSEVDVAKRSVKPGKILGYRVAEIRSDIASGKKFELDKLIGGEQNYEAYSWGWSFVHFMMESPTYSKKFRQYFLDLAKAKDVERTRGGFNFLTVSAAESLRVFMKRFGVETTDKFQAEWWAYVEKLEEPGVHGFEQAGIDAFNQGRLKFRASRLLKAAIDGGSTNPEVYIRLARCMRWTAPKDPEQRSPKREEALALIEKAIQKCDPLCADLIAEKGYIFYEMDRKEEAKGLLALAREMNPAEEYIDIEIAEALAGAGNE